MYGSEMILRIEWMDEFSWKIANKEKKRESAGNKNLCVTIKVILIKLILLQRDFILNFSNQFFIKKVNNRFEIADGI